MHSPHIGAMLTHSPMMSGAVGDKSATIFGQRGRVGRAKIQKVQGKQAVELTWAYQLNQVPGALLTLLVLTGQAVSFGLLFFTPLYGEYQTLGIPMWFLSCTIAQACGALMSSFKCGVPTPPIESIPFYATMADNVIKGMDGAVGDPTKCLGTLFACFFFSTLGTALGHFVLYFYHLGFLADFMPTPITCGDAHHPPILATASL